MPFETAIDIAVTRLGALDNFYHCHLCGLVMDRRRRHRNVNLMATRDHIIPRSLGGQLKGNVLLAHALCNTTRGNREITDEVRLECRTIVLKRYGFLIGDLERGFRKEQVWE